jgi:hypothetical protein
LTVACVGAAALAFTARTATEPPFPKFRYDGKTYVRMK